LANSVPDFAPVELVSYGIIKEIAEKCGTSPFLLNFCTVLILLLFLFQTAAKVGRDLCKEFELVWLAWRFLGNFV